MEGTADGTGHPRVRTFKARRGRTSPTQRARLHDALALFGLPPGPLTPSEVFGRSAPLVIEVGSGLGHAALGYAGSHPHHDLIAIDVHTPGIALLASRLEAAALTNLRVVEGDAFELLDRLPPASLHAVHLFFPDPWPKRAHHKRRFVRPDVIDLLASRLERGGRLLMATDDEAYAAAAAMELDAHAGFTGGPSLRPGWRPIAGYEARAIRLGHEVHDLCHRRR